MRRLRGLLIGAVVFGSLLSVFGGSAKAVTAADWKPGRIIDDAIFFNKDAMSVAQIQTFLDAKVPTCNRWHSSSNPNYQPPYTCLKEYRENTSTGVSNIGQFDANGNPVQIAGGKSAAQIIWDASQAYNINPQVMLVLLQKEQSLITDDWPWLIQYQHATGYSCPDTAPCNPAYAGFYRQVDGAAWQFRRYATYPDNYAYDIGLNNILWSPNSSCGSSQVNIENRATAMLYIYTPYQPNQAALNNLYGTGDGCSAYGNRNFWRMFNDWFGSTTGPEFAAELHSKSPFQVLNSGDAKSFYLQFKNIGRAYWKDDMGVSPGYLPVRIATTEPINRSSPFRAINWLAPGRPTGFISKVFEEDGTTLSSDQSIVLPSQIARYEFTIYANPEIAGGVYREYFLPILEGAPGYTWNIGGLSYLDIGIHVPIHKAAYHSQGPSPIISPDFSSDTYLQFKNVGNTKWYDDTSVPIGKYPVHLATSWPINRASKLAYGWTNAARPNVNFSKVYESNGTTLAADQHVVLPGQIARFEFSLKNFGNMTEGFHSEYFEPIMEGAPGYGWSLGAVARLNVGIPAAANRAAFKSQSAYPTLQKGGAAATSFIGFKNVGNTKWYDDTSVPIGKYPVHLATSWPINRASKLAYGWTNAARPNVNFSKVYESNGTTLAADQHVVLPGQIARFEFSLKADIALPSMEYKEYFEPIMEGAPGYSWSLGAVAWLAVQVE